MRGSGQTFVYLYKKESMEFSDTGIGKIALYRHALPERPLAVILFVHGLGEHSGRYIEWGKRFGKAGFAFISFDLPGHGLSSGRRGTMPSFEKVFRFIDSMIAELQNEFLGVPMIMYGHSLGGGIVLRYLLEKNQGIKAAIATSSWVRLAEKPPRLKLMIASVAGSLFPGLTQPSGLKTEYLSHDQDVVARYKNDPLVHGMISAGLFLSMTKSAEEVLRNGRDITLPLLLVHGSDDQITSPSGSTELASLAQSSTLKIWDGAYHEVHNDSMRDDHFEFIRKWIDTVI